MYYIDIKDVLNYCYCPMYYKFKSQNNLKDKLISTNEKFDKDMHESIYNYLELMQLGYKVDLKILNKKFITKWLGKNKHIDDILYVEPANVNDIYEHKRKKALASLNDLNKFFLKYPFYPIAINKRYKINITKNLVLTGTLEFIREINGMIEMISFRTDDKYNNNKVYVKKDIEITAAAYAYEKLTGKKIDMITFYGLDRNKIVPTTRNEEDYKTLIKIVKNVFKCIHNNIVYPCLNSNCISCLYNKICTENLNYNNLTLEDGDNNDENKQC